MAACCLPACCCCCCPWLLLLPACCQLLPAAMLLGLATVAAPLTVPWFYSCTIGYNTGLVALLTVH
eukprot:SAG11_NODE_37076_length_258_cov_1.245283_1_plen_65_part_10